MFPSDSDCAAEDITEVLLKTGGEDDIFVDVDQAGCNLHGAIIMSMVLWNVAGALVSPNAIF